MPKTLMDLGLGILTLPFVINQTIAINTLCTGGCFSNIFTKLRKLDSRQIIC